MEKQLMDLIIKAQNGSENAFSLIYESEKRKVLYLCVKMMGNMQDAEDAAQEAFIVAKKSLGSLKEPAAFNVWMNRITMSVCLRMLEKSAKSREIQNMDNYEDLDGANVLVDKEIFSPTKLIEEQEEKDLLMEIIDNLSSKYKSVILLFYYEGMSHSEIAQSLGMSKASVDHTLRRARDKIKFGMEKLVNEKKISPEKSKSQVYLPLITVALSENEEKIISSKVLETFDLKTKNILSHIASASQKNIVSKFLVNKNLGMLSPKSILVSGISAVLILGTSVGIYIGFKKPNNSSTPSFSSVNSTFEFSPQSTLISELAEKNMDIDEVRKISSDNIEDSLEIAFFNDSGERSLVNPVQAEIYTLGIDSTSVHWKITKKETGELVKEGTNLKLTKDQLTFPTSSSIQIFTVEITAKNINEKIVNTSQEIIITN